MSSSDFNGAKAGSTRGKDKSERVNYKIDTEGLNVVDEDANDDEYRENEDAGSDEDEEYTPGGSKVKPVEKKRGRSARSDSEFEEDDEDDENESKNSKSKKARVATPSVTKEETSNPPTSALPNIPIVRVVNEEYALPEDPEGEKKISADGDLLDGRKFTVRTFTLIDKGDRKFMLATEPARAVGLRDSHLFFQQHPNLYRYVPGQGQKNDMIERGLIPYSYKSRQIALVTSKSVFKEFGSRIIEDGKEEVDDYYITIEKPSRKQLESAAAAALAAATVKDYPKRLTKRGMEGLDLSVAAQDINPARNAVEFFDRRSQYQQSTGGSSTAGSNINATNWLYQHAAACSRFNSDMYYDRVRVLIVEQQGLRDPYTNVLHLPNSTQSTKAKKTKILPPFPTSEPDTTAPIIYETKIFDNDLTKKKTDLKTVPLELFKDVVTDEIRDAILQQQNYETLN